MARSVRAAGTLSDVLDSGGAPKRRTFRLADVAPGWAVVDNQDAPIGTVLAVADGFIVVRQGFLAPKLYVPAAGVGVVTERLIALNVPASWLGSLGWRSPPRAAGHHGMRPWTR